MSEASFLWHDYETFGTDPRRDRPAQFAAWRTDARLEPTGEPVVLHCRPTEDLLPVPEACLLTRITPQKAASLGLPEYRFATAIHELMTEPGTCMVGYNNFRFDDEVTRFLFWRNFYDPYAHEYSNANSRFDIIDVMRLARALRPEGIEWVNREDGQPGFRLEELAAANSLDTSRSHDALGDVEATIGLARVLKRTQPRLWSWALGLRRKHFVAGMLSRKQALLHASARFPAADYCIAPILPLCPHPHIGSRWLAWNLRHDPEPYVDLPPDELADLHWTPAADLPKGMERLPVKWIRVNRCPMLAPLGVLDRRARQRLRLDERLLTRRIESLNRHPAFAHTLAGLFDEPGTRGQQDPEMDLYGGFAPRSDQNLIARVRETDADGLVKLGDPFEDPRLNELLFRYRARHFPASLDDEGRRRWEDYRRRRLYTDPDLATIRIPEYASALDRLARERPDEREILDDLIAWPGLIGAEQLAPEENSSS